MHGGRSWAALLAAVALLAGCGGVGPDSGAGGPTAARDEGAGVTAEVAAPTDGAEEVKPLPGYRAAEIVATDVVSGEEVSLADLKGKVVFLNFWATWCPPCKEEMPAMEQLHQEMGDQVRILAIGADDRESPEKMAQFAEAMGLTFSVVYDGGNAARDYQIQGVPTSFFIDPEGLIQVRHTGQLSLEEMKDYVEQASKQLQNM